MAATDQLLSRAVQRDPARPLLTYYDDKAGERAELSATTLANWVAKTANLLQDEIALGVGDRVAVLLPTHWQTAAVLLASWAVGGVVGTEPAGAAIAFTDVPRLPRVLAAAPGEVAALSLAPMGQGLAEPADGALDFAAVVRAHGDSFSPYAPVPEDAPAVDDDGMLLSGAELVEEAHRRAGELGLREGDRVLTVLDWEDPADWVDGLLAPLAAGASLVLCVHPDPELIRARAEAEQVSATVGVTVDGIRAL
jgi:uncharacterized protein (TIGR03089 family)